jgi:hypothetical protein
VLDSLAYRSGDTRRYATNRITVLVADAFTPIRIAPDGGGDLTMGFYGAPGYAYLLQHSSNLVEWVAVATNMAPVSGPHTGLFQFNDTPPHSPAVCRAQLP